MMGVIKRIEKMSTVKIQAQWDEEAGVWVATSEDVAGLAIEASTMEALIERLKIVIPELMELNRIPIEEDMPFCLEGVFAGKIHTQHCCH